MRIIQIPQWRQQSIQEYLILLYCAKAVGQPSPWEVRQKIRQLAHDGADHIKILSSGAVLTHGSNPKSQEFTMEELQAAVDEAGRFGLRVGA